MNLTRKEIIKSLNQTLKNNNKVKCCTIKNKIIDLKLNRIKGNKINNNFLNLIVHSIIIILNK